MDLRDKPLQEVSRAGSRFGVLPLGEDVQMGTEPRNPQDSLGTDSKSDNQNGQAEKEAGREKSQEVIKALTPREDGDNSVMMEEINSETMNLEGKSSAEKNLNEDGMCLDSHKDKGSLDQDTMLSKEKAIPRYQPKISFKGDRIPLSSNSKLATLRGPKIRKGSAKRLTRPSISGKENSKARNPKIVVAAIQSNWNSSSPPHGASPSSNNSCVQATPSDGVLHRGSHGGPIPPGSSPDSQPSRLEINVFLPPENASPLMLLNAGIPYVTDGPMRALRETFMSMLTLVPLYEFDRYPSFPMFNMSIKILVWNVQGAGNKVQVIRELVRINKPSVLVLVETHLSGEQAQKICDRIGFAGQKRVEAQGFSGGIWMLWDTQVVAINTYGSHSQHLTVEISKLGEEPWLFSAIYASPDSSIRKELWRELEQIKDKYSGPWMLAGDFNETMRMQERNGVNSPEMARRCRDFSDWVNNNALIDLGCSGPEHTWFRGQSSDTFKSARLDRGLANEDWRLRFSEGAVRNLPKAASDHCPIIISTTGFAPIPMVVKPFRFQAAWLNHGKFHEFVYSRWNKTTPIVPFLRDFASQLQQWNKEEFYNIFRKKSELWARLEGIQRILATGRQSHLIKLEAKLRREMDDVLNDEEMLWFQKSRMEAICDGDRNTRYFHLSTIIKRRRNRIEALMDESNSWVNDDRRVKKLIFDYWSSLFREEDGQSPRQSLL